MSGRGEADGHGAAASVANVTRSLEGAGCSVAFVSRRAFAALDRAHRVDAPDIGGDGAAAVVGGALVDVLADEPVPAVAGRTVAASEGPGRVDAVHPRIR